VTQNPATDKIIDTGRLLLVARRLSSEPGAADKFGGTGHDFFLLLLLLLLSDDAAAAACLVSTKLSVVLRSSDS